MATCAKCGESLETGEACAHCGRIVAPREAMSLGLGVLFGILLTFALWLVVSIGWLGTIGAMNTGRCETLWASRTLYTVIFVGCLAALAAGIHTARRGYPARAAVFIIPAIGLLIPAAACSTSMFAASC